MSSISLVPSDKQIEEPPFDLGQQISRITKERGSFGLLSEAELQKEHDTTQQETEDSRTQDASDAESGSSTTESPSFEELRAQLAAKVSTALNEAALNLDLVSLLVSASRPQAGESSISPMLRSQTPMASLNAETVAVSAPAVPATSSYGWKVKAYRRSAATLLSASERLHSEAQREAQFWHDLLETTRGGEVVNRKLRVTYGYRDCGSSYFDKGTGSFARDEATGHALFKPHTSSTTKLVRVTLIAEGGLEEISLSKPNSAAPTPQVRTPEPERVLGQSVLPFFPLLKHLREPLLSVRVARNSLFEHELMFQLIQEARTNLAPHRVKLLDGGKLVCDLFSGRLEFDMVEMPDADADEHHHHHQGEPRKGEPVNPAEAINYALHLLLTQHYASNFERHHRIPRPLNSKAKQNGNAPSQTAANAGNTVNSAGSAANTRNRSNSSSSSASSTAKSGDSSYVLQPVLAYIHHSILVARTVKLVQIMLTKASVTKEPTAASHSLRDAPVCKLNVVHNDQRINIEVHSPVSSTDGPMVIVHTNGKSTDIYDLIELELWLKWIVNLQDEF